VTGVDDGSELERFKAARLETRGAGVEGVAASCTAAELDMVGSGKGAAEASSRSSSSFSSSSFLSSLGSAGADAATAKGEEAAAGSALAVGRRYWQWG
jgi:hypothetical protein